MRHFTLHHSCKPPDTWRSQAYTWHDQGVDREDQATGDSEHGYLTGTGK